MVTAVRWQREGGSGTVGGGGGWQKERGSIRFTPTRDLRASLRPLLSVPPHLHRSRGISRFLSSSSPFSLLSLTHLRCKLSFSSFLSRSFCLSCVAVIFQWEIYTTLRYVLYTFTATVCRAAFHRGHADLSKYLPSDNAPDCCR